MGTYAPPRIDFSPRSYSNGYIIVPHSLSHVTCTGHNHHKDVQEPSSRCEVGHGGCLHLKEGEARQNP